jgi:uncharacterized protein (TIGR00255 family)
MIRSMTGFGRAGFEVSGVRFEVEVRCLNSRHLDVSVRLPRLLTASEADVRTLVQKTFSRGKADLVVAAAPGAGPLPRLEVDLAAAAQYMDATRVLANRHKLSGDLRVAELLALPSVARFVEVELPPEVLHDALVGAVREALEGADRMRIAEGLSLERELRSRLERVLALTASLEERAGLVQASVRERLRKRAEQLQAETGLELEARLAHEIVLAADRLDVTEELVRLRSHVEQFQSVLEGGGASEPSGRRLEFLLQELSREANTVGSKGSDAPVAHLVVELKTELERLREQVLNVE